MHGGRDYRLPSQFLAEIPAALVQRERMAPERYGGSASSYRSNTSSAGGGGLGQSAFDSVPRPLPGGKAPRWTMRRRSRSATRSGTRSSARAS